MTFGICYSPLSDHVIRFPRAVYPPMPSARSRRSSPSSTLSSKMRSWLTIASLLTSVSTPLRSIGDRVDHSCPRRFRTRCGEGECGYRRVDLYSRIHAAGPLTISGIEVKTKHFTIHGGMPESAPLPERFKATKVRPAPEQQPAKNRSWQKR